MANTKVIGNEDVPLISSTIRTLADARYQPLGDYATISQLLNNIADGQGSSAIHQINNIANGDYSFASGIGTTASGNNSFSSGEYTIAQGTNQAVIGKYNIADSDNLFIIGKGTSNDSRSDAFTVGSNGGTTAYGKLVANAGLSIKSGSGQTSPPFFLCLNNSGDVGYVTKANMRSAIGANSEQSYVNGSSINLTSSKDTTLCHTSSLSAGQYLVIGQCNFASNSTGHRRLFLSTSNTGATMNRFSTVIHRAVGNTNTQIQLVYLANLSSATTLYLRGFQDSGATLSCSSGLVILKIPS